MRAKIPFKKGEVPKAQNIMADEIIKCLAYKGKVSVTCVDTTNLVEKARKIHNLSPVCTAAFGRLLTMTVLMGAEMKSENNKLTIQVKGDGPIGNMVTVSNNTPKVKGYVTNPSVDLPLNEFR
jgi:molecular chaperone Hsp33